MKTLFEVIDYNVDRDCNLLFVALSTDNNCYIPLDQFEKWLKRSDRLEWSHDWSDHDGEHCQVSGKWTIQEYWEQYHELFLKKDIYDFIVIHFTDPFKDIQNSITKITTEYAAR